MVYYNPHTTGKYNPLYTLNNQGPFFHCSTDVIFFHSLTYQNHSEHVNDLKVFGRGNSKESPNVPGFEKDGFLKKGNLFWIAQQLQLAL